MSNVQHAVGLVQAAGRGADTELAHFTRDELSLLDAFNGGQRDVNPDTGLPQYGWLGNLLKGLVRAGATIAGGMIAGPAGAAAGSGISTKLTGGSWNDALKGAAISGIGSFAAQGLGGGGWNVAKPWGASAAGAGGAPAVGSAAGAPGLAGQTIGAAPAGSVGANLGMGQVVGAAPAAAPISTAALSPSALSPGLGSQFLSVAKSAPGIVASLGALSQPFEQFKQQAPQQDSGPHFAVTPMEREQIPYEGDFKTYGERGMHRFYNPINPPPNFVDPVAGGVRYATGGPVGYNAGGAGLAGPSSSALQQAAMQGYMAAKNGGRARGRVSGPGTGTSDSIPARLSDGEHVVTNAEISSLGGGDNDLGQKRMYQLRREIKKKGPTVMRGIGNLKIKPRGR